MAAEHSGLRASPSSKRSEDGDVNIVGAQRGSTVQARPNDSTASSGRQRHGREAASGVAAVRAG